MDGLARIAGFLFRLTGWRVVGQLPSQRKFIVIVAPHTSNWDFFLGMTLGFYWKAMRKTMWFGKHSIFTGLMGRFLRALGGVPVDRSNPQEMVSKTIELLQQREDLILGLAPEGTRKWTDHWKSGFYRIAVNTGLPVVLVFLDYKNKRVGAGPVVQFTGQQDADWDLLRQFYQKEWARYPEEFSEIRPRNLHRP